MASQYQNSSNPVPMVTDQTGREFPGVPGWTRQSNAKPYKKAVSIIPIIGKKPPTHSTYASLCNKISFFESSYEGGSDYKDATDADGLPIFCAHPNESPDSAKMRKRLAVVRNYCYALSSKMGNFIFSQPIIRSTDPGFVEWAKDVDGNGTSLAEFMECVSEYARYCGIYGIIFDTTKENETETQATAKANGNRPVLSYLHPNRILNWSEDRQQLLVRHDVGEYGEVWLWTRESITKFSLDDKGKVVSMAAPVLHGYPTMPIVLISGLNDYKSLIRDIAELQKRLFHLDSVLIEEVVRQTFTSYFLVGMNEKELDQTAPMSISGRKFTLIGKNPAEVRIDPIGSDISQASSIRESIDMDEREIFRTMGLRLPDVVENHPESGRALRIRQGETVAMAERIAENTENAEERVMDLYNFATGSAVEPPEYPDEFNEDDLQILLADTVTIMSANFGPQMKAQQAIKYIRQNFKEIDPQLRIQMEQEAIHNPLLIANPALAAGVPIDPSAEGADKNFLKPAAPNGPSGNDAKGPP